MKKIFIISAIVIAVLGLGALLFIQGERSQPAQGDAISETGIHWHADLAIYIKGQKQTVPKDIGIGIVHKPFHTHDGTGQLHLEFGGKVTKEDIKLKKFFENWNKTFSNNCIFEHCNGSEGKVKFLVNGKENSEFENHEVQDGEKLEVRFE